MDKITTAVFPIAGLGTRFLPLTKIIPKELIPILDKPLLDYAISEAIAAGIEEFIFVTSRNKPTIDQYLDSLDLPRKCLHIVYQDQPLGLGHAVLCAQEHIKSEDFAVILPDDLIMADTPCLKQLSGFWQQHGGGVIAAMDVEQDQVSKYGIIAGKDHESYLEITSLVEKPSINDAQSSTAIIGRYILPTKILDCLEEDVEAYDGKNEVQLTPALSRLIDKKEITALRFEGQRFDCGNLDGWLAANIAYGANRSDTSLPLRDFLKGEQYS